MTFTASYTIKARDLFTPVAKKIELQFDNLNRKAMMFNRTLNKTGAALAKTGQIARSDVAEINALAASLGRVNAEMASLSRRRMPNFNTPNMMSGGGIGGVGSRGNLKGAMRGAAFGGGVPFIARQFMGGYLAYQGVSNAYGSVFEMEKNMSNLSALTGKSGADIEKLKNASYDYAVRYKQSASMIAEGMASVGNLKADLNDDTDALIKYTGAVASLQSATGDTFENSGKGIIALQNIFHATNERAMKYPDMLAMASRKGGVEVPGIIRAVLNVGGIAKAAGLDEAGLLSLIEIGGKTSIGKPGQEGTGIKSLLTRLSIKGYDFGQGGSEAVFKTIYTQANKIKERSARMEFYKKTFGLHFIGLGIALDEFNGDFKKLSDHINNSADESLKMGKDRLDNTVDDWQAFKSSLSKLSDAVIETKSIKSTLRGATNVVDFIANDINSGGKNNMEQVGGSLIKTANPLGVAAGTTMGMFGLIQSYFQRESEKETNVNISLSDDAKKLLTASYTQSNSSSVGKNNQTVGHGRGSSFRGEQ